ncbi:MAG TPA: SDR family NAD(P)-dependent oxidoreductase, partial [Streptosporangiaceae bacterium]|nr:SDR family NAD(P)-dependent oxidoreductase [Streptosporangiaceae bacterium]
MTVDLSGSSTLVTGGASGLGRATAEALAGRGAYVTIVDLPASNGAEVADKLGSRARFAAADVTSTAQMTEALNLAERSGPLRAVVHCAGRGARIRVVEKDGEPGSLETYEEIVKLNLVGSFNVLRLAAARMARAEPVDGERGVCVLTASVAAWEGQIGQIP